MVDNLRLGSSSAEMTLTSADSDVSSDWILPVAQTSSDSVWSNGYNSANLKRFHATGNAEYGNYYNWYTATAGTGLGTMSSVSATDLTNAENSICPKGWGLPYGGQNPTKSFYALDIIMGGTGANRTDATSRDKYLVSPYNFLYSGYRRFSGGIGGAGVNGWWWTRSASTFAGAAYGLRLYSDGLVSPQSDNSAGDGFAVRCLAK